MSIAAEVATLGVDAPVLLAIGGGLLLLGLAFIFTGRRRAARRQQEPEPPLTDSSAG